MQVIKRQGHKESVSFDKITERITAQLQGRVDSLNRWNCPPLDSSIEPISIAKETINGLYDGITTKELDVLSSDICATKIHHHPDYNYLASRIIISNLQKSTNENYMTVVEQLHHENLLTDSFYQFVQENQEAIQDMFDYSRDFRFDYFGFKTLERSYLLKIGKNIIERPQHLWMRVAIQVHAFIDNTIEEKLRLIKETYDGMSQGYFTHATPTLFNSGTPKNNLSSCFLINIKDDTEHMYKVVQDMALISRSAGGIGCTMSNIRCKDSLIHSTQGRSNGIIPYCKVLEATARHINQGSKRLGSIAVYLEPWHADVYDFVELRKNVGEEFLRARDLFLALWIPDLFMKRVEADGVWSLMCPNQCPNLTTTYGEEFERLYEGYEREGRFMRQVKARDLWRHILDAQLETGVPYTLFKDHVNRKNNQKNLGTIQCSNLCAEIVEYTSETQTAVCTLASLCLGNYVKDGEFDYDYLGKMTQILVQNLNNVIDTTYYPIPETKNSNLQHRPMGIGTQGLADVYCKMKVAFDSTEAMTINKRIYETIYYNALVKSNELAKIHGAYSSFKDSPFSQGQFQWNLWNVDVDSLSISKDKWDQLKENVIRYGMRNSLLTANMPTASTSQIMKQNEAFEPFTTNLYLRKTLSGEYIIVNEFLVRDLIKLGLWDKQMYEEILYFEGSIQTIDRIPDRLKQMYKTAYELKQSVIITQAADRGCFVDQTQSMNLFFSNPDFNKINSSHFMNWKKGNKTSLYYLRSAPAKTGIKFGLDVSSVQRIKNKYNEDNDSGAACTWVRKGQPVPEGCLVCSS